jgi:elongation factor Ts
MGITTEDIKKLREQTGAGMMDCKKALEETKGDMKAAVEYLRKKGAAVAVKRADRAAKEGMIVTRVSTDRRTGVIVEVNCETDFVGRSDDFVAFANAVAGTVEQHAPATLDALMNASSLEGKPVAALQNDLLAKVGEKIEVRRFRVLRSTDGMVSNYTHMGSKIGVLVELVGLTTEQSEKTTGRDIAMQIAAMNPLVVSRDQVDPATVTRELEIYRTQAKNEGKPDQVLDKIANGRLEKFYQEMALVEQMFIKDQGKTVNEVLREAGNGVRVKQFTRYHLGEEAS